MRQNVRICGIFAAAVSFVDEQYNLAPSAMVEHIKALLADGCHGVVVFGSTGEGCSFSAREKISFLEQAIRQNVPGEKIWVGTGSTVLDEAAAIARAVVHMRLGGILALPPFYYRPLSDQAMIAWYSALLDRLDSDVLRVILYHIPPMGAPPVTNAVIQQLRTRYGPQIVGVKDSSNDFSHMKALVRNFPELAVFSGMDHKFLPLLSVGGAGSMTAMANLIAPLLRYGWDLAHSKEQAGASEKLLDLLQRLNQARQEVPLISAIKAALVMRRGEKTPCAQTERCRPPLLALEEGQRAQFLARISPLLVEMDQLVASRDS